MKIAQNVHRAYLANNASMGADFTSEQIDFKEMIIGSVQAKWEGNDAEDGKIIVEGSNIPSDEWYSEVNGAEKVLTGSPKTQLFNLGVLGFRYLRVKYLKGANTSGTITIISLAKKGG